MDTFFNKQVPDNMPPLAATIGMFDGVHRGHRLVVDNLRQAASARGLKTAVFTFTIHSCCFTPTAVCGCSQARERRLRCWRRRALTTLSS